jgi:hypothetical protein
VGAPGADDSRILESVATTTRTVADEDLFRLPRDGRKYELVDGQIRVTPAGGRHGQIIIRLTLRLGLFSSLRSS